jgi:thioredoxin 1
MNIVLTDENFEKEINKAPIPVVVDFFATWCEPCNMLGPILEKVAEDLEGKIILGKVNVNEMPVTSQKFGVDRIPMVGLFDKGKMVSNFIGLKTEDSIKSWLKETLKARL